MDNNYEINQAVPEEKPITKKPSKVGAIAKGLLIMLLYFVLESIPQLIVLAPILAKVASEATAENGYRDMLISEMAKQGENITIATFVGMALAVLMMVIWYYFGVYKKNVKNGTYESVVPKLKNPKSWIFIICGSFAIYGLDMLIKELSGILMPSISDAYNSVMGVVTNGVSWLGVIITLVLAPIGEELFLRGVAFVRLKKSFGLAGCMIISALLFGLFHANPIQGLYVLPMGLFLGFVAYKFNSVIPCIIVHFLNNIMAGFTSLLLLDKVITQVLVLVVLGATAVFFGNRIDFFREKETEE